MTDIYGTTTKISTQTLEIIPANTESRYNLFMLYALCFRRIPKHTEIRKLIRYNVKNCPTASESVSCVATKMEERDKISGKSVLTNS